MGKESRRKWMAGVGRGECLIGGTGAWADLPGETKTDFLQPDVCWTKELERVGGGAVICSFRGPKAAPHQSLRESGGRSFQPPREEPSLPDCHRSLQDFMGRKPSRRPPTNSESFLFLSPILATASDSFTLSRLRYFISSQVQMGMRGKKECPRII